MPTTTRRMLALVFVSFGCSGRDAPTDDETTTGADGHETTTGDHAGGTTSGSDAGGTTSGSDAGETATGGDPCELGGNVCLDENTLGVCNVADQSTMPVSCADTCMSMGFSNAIGCRVATEGVHQCYCDQATATCTESACGGGNVLAECTDGVLDPRDCEQECQAMGMSGECSYDQLNALYSCNCTGASPCTENTTFCQDSMTQMRCANGVWQPQACTDEACDAEQCMAELSSCPPGYHAQTLGCGYDSFYGDTGCRCTV